MKPAIPPRQRSRGKTFLTLGTLPPINPNKEGEKLNPVYEALFSDAHKEAALILLMNELRACDPQHDSDESNRAVLAKVKTLSELVDLEYILVSTLNKEPEERQDELPDAAYASEEPDINL